MTGLSHAGENDTWDALRATAPAEIVRRARIVQRVEEVEPLSVGEVTRYAWNDGAGQSTVWYVFPDGRILLLTYEHEYGLNMYGHPREYELQEQLYRGVPEELLSVLRNQPENYESLNVTDAAAGQTLLYGGGVFVFDGTTWAPSPGVVDFCDDNDLYLWLESGFNYCLEPYHFGEDFTVEVALARRQELGYPIDADERNRVSEIFRAG